MESYLECAVVAVATMLCQQCIPALPHTTEAKLAQLRRMEQCNHALDGLLDRR